MPFLTNGIVITDISNNSNDNATGVALDGSGNIVVVGYTNINNVDFAVVRYLPTGQLDASFGPVIPGISGGIVITEISNNSFDQANCVAIDTSSGCIVVAGTSNAGNVGSNNDFAVVRYLPNGNLDPAFGPAPGGKAVTDISGGTFDSATCVAIDPNSGHIVAAGFTVQSGTNYENFAVVRYLPDGNLDPSFGPAPGGKVITELGGTKNQVADMAIDANGRIVVAGFSNVEGLYDFALVRYLPNGSLDPSFGENQNGIVLAIVGSGDDFATSVAIDTSGHIIVAGYTQIAPGRNNIVVLRFTDNGWLDTANFGTGGSVVTNISGDSNDVATGVAIDTSGRIVVSGTTTVLDISHKNFAVVRYLSNGTPDASFGSGGIVITDISGSSFDRASRVQIDTEGRIVVAGSTKQSAGGGGGGGSNYDFAVARYLSDGALDGTTTSTTSTTTLTTTQPTTTSTTTLTTTQPTTTSTTTLTTTQPTTTSTTTLTTTQPTTTSTTTLTTTQPTTTSTTTLTTTVPPDNIYICFKEGTRILTSTGYVRVETLVEEQLIQTFRHGLVPLRALGRSRVFNDGSPARLKEKLYVYRRGCLGEQGSLPFADLVVTGEHSALVPALRPAEKAAMSRHFGSAKTTDGQYHLLAQHDVRAVPYEQQGVFTVYHFALACGSNYERHYGVFANGMLMESCSVNHLRAIMQK